MKHRLQRVKVLIQRELGELITRDFEFPGTLVTVQAVDLTPDLKQAYVYVSVIGSDAEQRDAVALLNEKRVLLQHSLSRRVVLKFTPHLTFRLDESVERGTRIITILEEISPQLPPPTHEP